MPTFQEIHKITEHNEMVFSIIFLLDGRLASCSYDGTIKVFDPITYKCELSISYDNALFPYLSLLNNGNIVASSSNGNIYIFSISNQEYRLVHQITSAHGGGTIDMGFSLLKEYTQIEEDNQCIETCDINNNKWYIEDGEVICFSNTKKCPDEYSCYIKEKSQCISMPEDNKA